MNYNEVREQQISIFKDVEASINDYINERNIKLNRINLDIERIAELRETLPLDEVNRDEVLALYNEREQQLIKDREQLLNPSKEDRRKISDEILQHTQTIHTKIREVEKMLVNLSERKRQLDYEFHGLSPLDSNYYKIKNELEDVNGLLRNLDILVDEYKKLLVTLKDYEQQVFKAYYKELSDILNRNYTPQKEIVPGKESQNFEDVVEQVDIQPSEDDTMQFQNADSPTTESVIEKNNDESVSINDKYQFKLNKEATMQNYRNSGYSTNAYGWYFSPSHDDFIEGYNPLEDSDFQMFDVFEKEQILDENATMQNYRNSGYSTNAYGWYFSPSHDDFIEGYNPLEDSDFQVFRDEFKYIGEYSYTDAKFKFGYDPSKKDMTEGKNIVSGNTSDGGSSSGNDDSGKSDDSDSGDSDDSDDTDDEDDLDENNSYSYDEAIRKLIESLSIDMPEELKENILNEIDRFVLMIFEKELDKLEHDLSQINTVVAKINYLSDYSSDFSKYLNYYKSENPEINALLEKRHALITEKLFSLYTKRQSQGEYCWQNYKSVKSSMEYIRTSILSNPKAAEIYSRLFQEMFDLVANPLEDKYGTWQNNLGQFVANYDIDFDKVAPYFTAELKMVNKDLAIDGMFNISGLSFIKAKEPVVEDKPKKRRKVTGFKKITNWMKEHKLATIAIGLALAGTSLMLIPQTHMMINSALWAVGKKLGFGASSLTKLNSTNIALSKVVKGGKYAFNGGSGLYTLGGVAGAKALYTSASAKLVGALQSLLVGGSIGTGLVAVVKSVAKKIKAKKDAKLERLSGTKETDEQNLENKNVELSESEIKRLEALTEEAQGQVKDFSENAEDIDVSEEESYSRTR